MSAALRSCNEPAIEAALVGSDQQRFAIVPAGQDLDGDNGVVVHLVGHKLVDARDGYQGVGPERGEALRKEVVRESVGQRADVRDADEVAIGWRAGHYFAPSSRNSAVPASSATSIVASAMTGGEMSAVS